MQGGLQTQKQVDIIMFFLDRIKVLPLFYAISICTGPVL